MRPQETIDMGWDHYLQELDESLSYVDVGILKDDASAMSLEGDITLGQKAFYNEYGTDSIPERPFMRQTFDEQMQELQDMADKLENDILVKKTSKRHALNTLGVAHQTRIQKNIATKGKFEKNAQSTIDRKGSSMPLEDTRQMTQALSYEVG